MDIAIRKSSKMTMKSPKLWMQSDDRPKIEFKVACDVIESVEFVKIYGFYDVTSDFELDFQAIG